MAAFDADERKIVVRVVFDGPGFAGKTTNIQQLHGFFTERRRSELIVPDQEAGERTQFFDWMHLDGGLVHGYGLRCQLVSVPGQRALTKRRWRLLRDADALVFVTESTPEGLKEGKPMFAMLREYLEHRHGGDAPLVVQANKQDLPEALGPEGVRRELGVDPETPLVAATASTGGGVRETVVLAIRTAANRVQAMLLDGGIEGLPTGPQRASEVLADLRALPLEVDVPEPADVGAGPKPPQPSEGSTVVEPGRASEDRERTRREPSSATPPPPGEAPLTAAAPSIPNDRHQEPGADSTPPPSPMLTSDAPSGYIWPAATGREALRRACAAGVPVHQTGLSSQNGLSAGSGGDETLVYRAGAWCLKTSRRRCYRDADEGRAALLRLARSKAALGHLLAPSTVVSLQDDGHGWLWLWTVSPWTPPLRSRMQQATEQGNEEALGEALRQYARGVVASVVLAARRGVVVDVHPSNFASIGEDVYYLDDDVVQGTTIPSVGHAILQRVVEYEAYPRAVEAFLDTLVESMRASLTHDDLRASALEVSFRAFGDRTEAATAARNRVASFLADLGRNPGALAG